MADNFFGDKSAKSLQVWHLILPSVGHVFICPDKVIWLNG
jgi:hypothetical protein